ncbi:tRNA (Cytosine-5-)-methyltransferase [Operophtera brumata]|uniref:tRNA (Cytosine-5-)-methyltransferase n=1 Tax=Operophtera brumata TaxID=104452 RepID=A0A0L7L1Q8_OPEBR|nr:tRNA (Cytosine-5-)-methyltransferase [Operophtera brumata]
MGRKNRNVNKFAQRKRDRKEQEKNPQPKPEGDQRKHYADIVRENATFEEYYKSLPTAFRITGSKCEADELMNIVQSQYFSEILNVKLKVEGTEDEEEIKPFKLPWVSAGFVMANDVDNSRCYMLVHQAKRLNSPKPLKFDRILCDVPCSGDATLRKNPDIWVKWSNGNGNNLHGIQYRILKRGCELLEVGGRLVYSTCSFNPIENEAVIHRVLAETGDSMRLVEANDMLTGLKYQKGMTNWRPASKDMVFYDKFEDVPERWQTVKVEKEQKEEGNEQTCEGSEASEEKAKPEPPRKKRRMGGYKEDPFVFFKGDEEDVFPSIRDFYDLQGFESKCLLTRCHVGKKKNIYLVSPVVRDVVRANEDKMKIINTGVKTFVSDRQLRAGVQGQGVEPATDSDVNKFDKKAEDASTSEATENQDGGDSADTPEISKIDADASESSKKVSDALETSKNGDVEMPDAPKSSTDGVVKPASS